MFHYDNDFTEIEWRHEADARELAQLDRDRRDMQEYLPPPLQMRLTLTPENCCDNPANFTLAQSFTPEYATGYLDSGYFRCICGNLICEEDYAALVEFADRQKLKVIEKIAAKHDKQEAA